MKTVQVYREGGLGDLILQHFADDRYESLASMKHWGEPIYARLILNTHNRAAAELFRYGAFDEIEVVGYDPSLAPQYPIDYADVPTGIMPVHFSFSRSDDKYIGDVLPGKSFTVCHPFTSSGYNALRRSDVEQIASRGPVVLVGAASERFEISNANVTNLVGLANPRIVCAILRHAAAFVGTMSCYCWASACHGIPSRAFRPPIESDPYLPIAARFGVQVVTAVEDL